MTVNRWKSRLIAGAMTLGVSAVANAQLLGIPTPGFPNTLFQVAGTASGTSYTPGSGVVSVRSLPVAIQESATSGSTFFDFGNPGLLSMDYTVDASGNFVGGVPGDDFTMSGDVTVNGTAYSGVLLTGEVLDAGVLDSGVNDFMDARLSITGGQLAPLYGVDDLGLVMTMENSTFTGNWSVAWTGDAKGNHGPIPPVPVGNASLGDFVWDDLNRDGIQNAGEPGINGVTVNLLDSNGDVIATTVTAMGAGGGKGFYSFGGLEAGTYTVSVDESTLPAGYVASPAIQGNDTALDNNGSPVTVSLTAGENNPTLDFGYNTPATGSIGDFIWNDLDRDGIQDAGEPGLNGITVQLLDANGDVVDTVVTMPGPMGNSGYYLFTGLAAGTYTVQVVASTLPPEFVASPTGAGNDPAKDSNGVNNAATATLAADDSQVRDIDFGYNAQPSGRIGDFVWFDQNGDGIQTAGEPGINGVRVILKTSFGQFITSTVTGIGPSGAAGYYEFTGLLADMYIVEVDASTLPAGYSPTLPMVGGAALDSENSPVTVTLPTDTSNDPTIDFGYVAACSGAIGDYIFNDLDGDGQQDANEDGLNGVTVELRDSMGQVIATAITMTGTNGKAGFYRFEGLCAGDYTVDVDNSTLPAGFTPSPVEVAMNRATDSNGDPASVTLPDDNTVDTTIDMGFVPAAIGVIGNFIWNDLNANGIQDAGEPGINGVKVLLKDDAGNVLAMTVTSAGGGLAAGFYEFTGLATGIYTIEVDVSTLPAGFVESPSRATISPKDSNGNPFRIRLRSNIAKNLTIDFGFYSDNTASLGNYVWNDVNANGSQDADEAGINGVTVLLLDANGVQVASAVTTTGPDGEGFYSFGQLQAGTYTVAVDESTLPTGFIPTLVGAAASDADSNGSPATVTLASGDNDPTIDFGYYRSASIGDTVFLDENRNGIQDIGEGGIAGAIVRLLDANGVEVASTSTSLDGEYLFAGLSAGVYTVVVDAGTLPASLDPTFDLDGITTANQSVVTLEPGDQRLDVDFGYGPVIACGECDGKLTNLSFTYDGPMAQVTVLQKKDAVVVFDGLLNTGDSFSVVGQDKKGTLGTEIILKVNGQIAQKIHTSCSVDIGIGDVYGDFTVTAGASRNGGPLCPSNIVTPPGGDDACAECDGKASSLTLGYVGAPGQLHVFNGDGTLFEGPIVSGDFIEVFGNDDKGTLGKELKLELDGEEIQKIHTSCSKPLEIGVVYGAFTILDGTSLKGGQLCPLPEPNEPPPPAIDCGECNGKVTELELRWNGNYDADIEVRQRKDNQIVFSDRVGKGNTFAFLGQHKRGTLGTEIIISVDGHIAQSIHTSCSIDIYIGSIFGDFEVVAGASRTGGLFCPQ